MSLYRNPFEPNSDRYTLWHMLVEVDIEAFVHSDWERLKSHFIQEGFTAIDARGSDNPDSWRLSFTRIEDYQALWLEQSKLMNAQVAHDKLRQAFIDATTMRDIEVEGDSALLHKKLDGQIVTDSGAIIPLHWQTMYQCIKIGSAWKIAGFVGFLPLPMGTNKPSVPAKQLPVGASQHATVGPYSPVLIVNPGQIVVISGQGAINPQGVVVGTTVQEQTEVTLEYCQEQLSYAGCGLKDVFKVNVYMTDLSQWDAFNEVYRRVMPEPRPVRTTVEARLLPGLLIEIEMWAVKS